MVSPEQIISTVLAPQFLTSNIPIIALIIAGALLVIFDGFVTKKIILKITDSIKDTSHRTIKKLGEKSKSKHIKHQSKFIAEILSTIFFFIYCFFGTVIVAQYVLQPLLYKLQNILLLVCIAVFFIISLIINTKSIRNKLMRT